jgi:hypothetical protein
MGDQKPKAFLKVHKLFMINRKKTKCIEDNIINIRSEKITLSQNLREKVLTEILKNEITKDNGCIKLNCCADYKHCN